MCITVTEMYEIRDGYDKQIAELEMKKAVVNDFIAFAESKEACNCEVEETETVEGCEEISVEEAVVIENY